MKTPEQKRKNENDRRRRLLVAGMCIKCMGNRTAVPGHTADRCAGCADKARTAQLARVRKQRGTPLDRPIVGGKRGPRGSHVSLIKRSDEYNPDAYAPLKPGPKKGSRSKSKSKYGKLSLEDIRRATSTLPLKPPGKS